MRRAIGPATAVVLAIAFVTADAPAQDDAAYARAEALFRDGSRAVNAGRYAEACPELERAQALVMGIGVTLYLAECYEQTGRLLDAWHQFRQAERLALARGDARSTIAHDRARQLESRLGQLPSADDGTPPTAPSSSAAPAPSSSTPGPPLVAGSAPTVPLGQPAIRAPTGDPQRAAGLAVLGAGAVGLVVGTVFGVMARSKQDDSNSSGHCQPDDHCDAAGIAERSDALTDATISTFSFIGGVACLAGGAALYLLAQKDTRMGLVLAPQGDVGATIGVRGAW